VDSFASTRYVPLARHVLLRPHFVVVVHVALDGGAPGGGELAALRPAALLQAEFLRTTTLTSSPEAAALRPEHSAA
jgi:hypothetical protein